MGSANEPTPGDERAHRDQHCPTGRLGSDRRSGSPTLLGFPFFYWYQLLSVPVTALLIWIVYRDGQRRGEE
jgi:hypothetical protein